MTSFIISCIPEPAIKETEIYADAARKTTGQEFHFVGDERCHFEKHAMRDFLETFEDFLLRSKRCQSTLNRELMS